MSKELRLAFAAKRAEVDALEAKIKPLRDEYDALEQAHRAKMEVIIANLKRQEAPLVTLKNELGALARALQGQTALQPGDTN